MENLTPYMHWVYASSLDLDSEKDMFQVFM